MWKWIHSLFEKNDRKGEENVMKYLIVGLGNLHPDYDDTRHNIGFDVVDVMAEEQNAPWKLVNLGATAEIKYRGRKLILLKPSTYMNRSGKSIRYWMQKENVPIERLMVVVDDIHLPIGSLRMRPKGSDGGHNGLKDIQEYLGSHEYPRIKVGIGNSFYKGQQSDYVLSKWSEEERKSLPDIIQKASDAIRSFTTIGMQQTMSKYNG